jgi:hypothetical protein
MPLTLGWIENVQCGGRQCGELDGGLACYGAPRAGGVFFAWLWHPQRFIGQNRAMGRADDDLQLGLGKIGRNMRRRQGTREGMRGHREGDREQQEAPQRCAHPSHTPWFVFFNSKSNGNNITLAEFCRLRSVRAAWLTQGRTVSARPGNCLAARDRRGETGRHENPHHGRGRNQICRVSGGFVVNSPGLQSAAHRLQPGSSCVDAMASGQRCQRWQ